MSNEDRRDEAQPSKSIYRRAAGNIAMLMSMVRCGESLTVSDERILAETLDSLRAHEASGGEVSDSNNACFAIGAEVVTPDGYAVIISGSHHWKCWNVKFRSGLTRFYSQDNLKLAHSLSAGKGEVSDAERSAVRYFASGPEGCFSCSTASWAERLIERAGYDSEEWTVTDTLAARNAGESHE